MKTTASTRSNIAIYSAVSNSYNEIKSPSYIDNSIDYIYFSDETLWNRLINDTPWNIKPFPKIDLDSVRLNRLVKIKPHVFLPEYEYSVYIDGNIDVIGDVRKLIECHTPFDMLAFKHPLRQCVYDEGNVCIASNKDNPDLIRLQLAEYETKGHPKNFGLIEANVLIRRNNSPRITELMDEWWDEVLLRSRRDQISFPYVARRRGFWPTLMGNENARGNSPFFLMRENVNHKPSPLSKAEKIQALLQKHVIWRLK